MPRGVRSGTGGGRGDRLRVPEVRSCDLRLHAAGHRLARLSERQTPTRNGPLESRGPMTVYTFTPSQELRLMHKIGEQTPSGCWPWLGALTSGGYGSVGVDSAVKTAHRVVYELLVGPVPEGLDLDHLCRNRWCVNPDHLEPVTRPENVRRGHAARRATHCKNGHELTASNAYTYPRSGHRACRVCRRSRRRHPQSRMTKAEVRA